MPRRLIAASGLVLLLIAALSSSAHAHGLGIFATPDKRLTFSTAERVDLAKRAVAHLKNVEVKSYKGMTVEFAREVGAKVMVRGLRMIGDFEWEFEMAMMNKLLAPEIELVCFMASQQYQFLSASLMKEVSGLGGDIGSLVPKHVAAALKKKGISLSDKLLKS